jgi:hypothetical protein
MTFDVVILLSWISSPYTLGVTRITSTQSSADPEEDVVIWKDTSAQTALEVPTKVAVREVQLVSVV